MSTIAKSMNNRSSLRTVPRQQHLTDAIGNTPLIALSAISKAVTPVKIFAKAEWFNPGGSVKDRAALNMIRHGIKSGELNVTKTILDATSGNTGIALAMIGASLGLRVKLCIPENAGPIHKQIMNAYGATLLYTDPFSGTDGAIRKARELVRRAPQEYFYVDQYNNEKNWQAHYESTGPEIVYQTSGQITHFVAGLGSSGTFVGTGRWLRKFNQDIRLISFQPDTPLHGMEGIKHMETAMVPGIYDPHLADMNLEITTEEAQLMVRRLAGEEGLLVGNSAGGAMAAALKVAEGLNQGVIVVIFPDGASKYMDQAFWKEAGHAS